MKPFRVCSIGLSFALAMAVNSGAGAGPDISGTYWAPSYSHKIQVLGDVEPPLNAAGKVAYAMNQAGLKDGSIVDKARRVCVPDGVPRVLATPYPFEIFQVPADQVTFLYEMNHQVRVVVMDKPLPSRQTLIVDPKYNGHSTGHWDGDTLVVESSGYDDRTWVDPYGSIHSDQMRLEERYTRLDHDTLEFSLTLTDPKAYVGVWGGRKLKLKLMNSSQQIQKGLWGKRPDGTAYGDIREEYCVYSIEHSFWQGRPLDGVGGGNKK